MDSVEKGYGDGERRAVVVAAASLLTLVLLLAQAGLVRVCFPVFPRPSCLAPWVLADKKILKGF